MGLERLLREQREGTRENSADLDQALKVLERQRYHYVHPSLKTLPSGTFPRTYTEPYGPIGTHIVQQSLQPGTVSENPGYAEKSVASWDDALQVGMHYVHKSGLIQEVPPFVGKEIFVSSKKAAPHGKKIVGGLGVGIVGLVVWAKTRKRKSS